MAPLWPGRRLRTPPGQDSPSPPGRCARFSEDDGPPLFGLAGDSERPLGRTPRPPWAGAPGPLRKMAPHWPGRRLRTPPGQDFPSPPGRCARFSKGDGPPLTWQETPNTPWAGLPTPPGPVRPTLGRRWPPLGLARDSEHPLGRAPHPPQAGAPGSLQRMAPHWPGRMPRPPHWAEHPPAPPGRECPVDVEAQPPGNRSPPPRPRCPSVRGSSQRVARRAAFPDRF